MAVLVRLDAAKVRHQLGWDLRHVLGQLDEPMPAQPGGLFGIHVEEAEVSERPEPQMLADIAGHLARELAGPGDQGRERSRQRRLGRVGMLPNRAGPAGQAARQLRGEGLGSQVQFKNGAANIDGMHLLVFPDPDEGVVNDIPHFPADGHRLQAADHHRLAIADGDQLFTFQRQEEEADHLLPGPAGVLLPPAGQFANELIVHLAHAGDSNQCRQSNSAVYINRVNVCRLTASTQVIEPDIESRG